MQDARKIKYALGLFFVVLMLLCAGCKPDAIDSAGKPIRISDFRGKWVIIQYWATWCSPCLNGMSVLNKLLTYYPKDVVVLGVNFDHLDAPVLQQLKQGYQVHYPLLSNFPIENYGVDQVTKIPVLFLINPKGRLVKTLEGPQTFEDLQKIMNLPPISYENI